MEEGRGKGRGEDGRERRGERRERGGRKRERRGRDARDKDRSNKRVERTHRQSQSGEKQDGSSHLSAPIKPPIILTKPMAEKGLLDAQGKDQKPGVIAIQRREDQIGVSAGLSVSLGASKPISIESSGKRLQDEAINQEDLFKHSSSAPMQTGHVGGQGMAPLDKLVTGLEALQMTPQAKMQHPMKIVDDSFHWSDKAFNSLLEQSDFVVVGVAGCQGTGKSSLLSLIGDSSNTLSFKSKLLFRPQSKQDVEKSLHRTEGIDMFVTSDRLILLDTQPLLSPSILDRFLRHEKKVSSDFGTAETCVEMQSLQILTFLFAVCHVVVVVMDHFVDLSILKFLKTAEMLKPSSVAHSGQEGPSSQNSEELDEYLPHVVFACNRCSSDMFCMEQLHDIAQVVDKFFAHSRLKTRGSASIIRANLLPFCKLNPFYDYQDLNIFFIPECEEDSDARSSSFSTYHGHPSSSSLLSSLKKQLLSMPRQHLTHHSLTERSWFHYAARTWEVIKKSPLLAEYQRMITT